MRAAQLIPRDRAIPAAEAGTNRAEHSATLMGEAMGPVAAMGVQVRDIRGVPAAPSTVTPKIPFSSAAAAGPGTTKMVVTAVEESPLMPWMLS